MGGERRVVRVGTRKSPLALWQTRWVIARLQEAWPGLHFEEVPMVTQGDLVLDRPLDQAGGRGLFVAEMEEALLAGRIDLAVHSMKDLPIELAPGLVLGPVPPGPTPGTSSSPARAGRAWPSCRPRPGWAPAAPAGGPSSSPSGPIWRSCPSGATWGPACASWRRARWTAWSWPPPGWPAWGTSWPASRWSPRSSCPRWVRGRWPWSSGLTTPGCGSGWHPWGTQPRPVEVAAERALLRHLGGGCHLPIAAWARASGDRLTLQARVISPDGARHLDGQLTGPLSEAASLGERLAGELLARGARDLL